MDDRSRRDGKNSVKLYRRERAGMLLQVCTSDASLQLGFEGWAGGESIGLRKIDL